ncbi:retrovirus-related pol polyprotein from transposon TNT 1-94 [Tanacetum coccineum]
MCPKDFNPRDKQNASTTLLKKKRVTFVKPCETQTHNPPAQVEHQKINSPNAPGIPSIGAKGDQCPLTRNTPPKVLPIKQWKPTGRLLPLERQCPLVRSTALKSGCYSKHMTGDRSRLRRNFVKKFIGTVRFRNDHFGAIMGYGDYVISDSVISRVYYMEGLGHNLFSVGQFCDSDLEVAFEKHTCFVRDLDGVDLIKGNRGTNLYTISIKEMMRGLPRLKFDKDHLCSAFQLGKSRKSTHKPKIINIIMEVLHTLHMDLCGPLRVQSINGKKYILVIVDDFSRFTWVKFLRSKDETLAFVINLLKQLQVGLNKTIRFVRTDNGIEFVNKDLTDYYESVGITHEKTVSRTPQQNGIVERRNRTLVEALTGQTAHVLSSPGPAPNLLTFGPISSGLVPNPAPAIPYVPPTTNELETLFQPMCDKYFENPPAARLVPPTPVAQVPVNQYAEHSVEVNPFAPADPEPFVNVFAPEPSSEASSSGLQWLIWVPIGKSNCYLDVERSQSNPIYKIAMDILKNTNFFRAFIASSTIPSIYIQQFWDTITPVDTNNPFTSPPTPDALIKFVNDLGYPKVTSGFERPRAPVLQILWGVVNRTHIDYAERMWEEFTQSIHTFIEDKENLARYMGKRRNPPFVNMCVRFTKLIVYYLQSKHKFHRDQKVATHQRYLLVKKISVLTLCTLNLAKATKPKAAKQYKPLAPKSVPITKPTAAKASKSQQPKPAHAKPQEKKRKLVTETSEAPSPAKRSKASVPDKEPLYGDEEADTQRAIEESLKEVHGAHRGPLPPVVFREPDSGKHQPLPEVQDQYIFQRRTSTQTEPSGHDESSSLYAELGLTDSETESDEEVLHAGSNPGDVAVSQPQSSHAIHARPNLEHMDFEVTDTSIQQNPEQMDKEFTTTAYLNVQENLKLLTKDQVRLEEPASSTGTLSSLQNLDKELSFADQFLVENSQEDVPEKTNTESEVQSMVTIPIHQDTSSVPLMTTSLLISQSLNQSPQLFKHHYQHQ